MQLYRKKKAGADGTVSADPTANTGSPAPVVDTQQPVRPVPAATTTQVQQPPIGQSTSTAAQVPVTDPSVATGPIPMGSFGSAPIPKPDAISQSPTGPTAGTDQGIPELISSDGAKPAVKKGSDGKTMIFDHKTGELLWKEP
jgi:hypothetical protein